MSEISREALHARFVRVRARTMALAAPLGLDEQLTQAFPDASPTKWHLAHTSWFFDRFVLAPFQAGHEVDPDLEYVFNSYYEAIGARQPRHQRALAIRPTLQEVRGYRARIDEAVDRFFRHASEADFRRAAFALELGTHHEEQHQELMLTDIKPVLASSRIAVSYPAHGRSSHVAPPLGWIEHEGGLHEIGARALSSDGTSFSFDNEKPRHRTFLEPYALASRPVTSGEFLAFIEDGGYRTPALWLSDGWQTIQQQGWTAPRYWEKGEDGYVEHELTGRALLDRQAPVAHVSFYEADAYARWAGARLPTEAEWEHASEGLPIEGNLLESRAFHPRAAEPGSPRAQHFGDVWEWTASSYAPYPRYQPFAGALGEYNGKFMCSQMVLRGGSCFTPAEHVRASYRNFFPPAARWQMTGLRLARWSPA